MCWWDVKPYSINQSVQISGYVAEVSKHQRKSGSTLSGTTVSACKLEMTLIDATRSAKHACQVAMHPLVAIRVVRILSGWGALFSWKKADDLFFSHRPQKMV